MSKSDLINKVAETTNTNKNVAKTVVNEVIETIVNTLTEGDNVQLAGLGTFEVITRAARKGHNLQTGEIIDVPEKKVPKFKAAKAFKDAVKES